MDLLKHSLERYNNYCQLRHKLGTQFYGVANVTPWNASFPTSECQTSLISTETLAGNNGNVHSDGNRLVEKLNGSTALKP
uniref:Uncharacterized protein n=1 Tax=Anguilla anguilla TaxID=7936 RepID=A0A0E9WUJ3_ANGAN